MKKLTNKRGISLIVLVITMIVPYYETLKASKIGKVPPKNKIETIRKLINIDRVVDFESLLLLFYKQI